MEKNIGRLSWGDWIWGLIHVFLDTITQRVWSCHLQPLPEMPAMAGVTCIVTGATSGIGLNTARELAKAGAHVVLAVRNTKAANELIKLWQKDQCANGVPLLDVEALELNLASLKSVRQFAKDWELQNRPLHILINNAGIFHMAGSERVSEDRLEEHMQVNHLAPSLLTMLLLPSLLRSGPSRVINVSSAMHHLGSLDFEDLNTTPGKKGFNSTAAYSSSKLAQLHFSNVLQRTLPEEANVDIISVHPGEVITNVVRTLPKWLQVAYRFIPFFLFTPLEGARSVLFCATDPHVLEYARAIRASNYPSAPYFSSACTPVSVAKQAMDLDAAFKTWNKTLELVGLPDYYFQRVVSGVPGQAETIETIDEED
ncbi:hypothetical protein SELMODRAFT_272004 [Selaginella moellendorffii]|uniref:Uncharacterized protein n=1 Tax=Selaginella moellendorffii TaxID=88036 RepID=D8SYR3_SELML|nr:dehydrogenase/reductase SDR family member FEY [Selaginella moellendorffii]EFJ10574.1 hypothetical protein SELMODRAFT_272004 [Selaginella moellendorffii]|eukprot:XP_024518057.1 dehydrogenase/reductase SDR family member FEY [Selaginella moellendorffii]